MEATRKYSKKREAILDAIRATKEHPSAEMLYSTLKPLYPDLSLGTVYRNLGVFLGDGEIVSVGSVNGQERYDANTSPHAHFVCLGCGRVIDVDSTEMLSVLYSAVSSATGGVVESHSLTFTGRCAECRDKTAH
ncbi:MAG: transcriptional repressor [Oscillospiraceae bacterium]